MSEGIRVVNGRVFSSRLEELEERDVLVEGGVVKAIDKPGSFDAAEVATEIDAKDCFVLPGLVDIHVHLREPGEEWKETIHSGTKAAIAGGFTTICCMPNTTPRIDSAETVERILRQADTASGATVVPIGAVSRNLEGKELAPLSELFATGCRAFSDDGFPVWNPLLMRRALEWLRMYDAPICCHQEERALTTSGSMNESSLSFYLGLDGMPGAAEDIFTSRDIELSRLTGGRIHFCHVSTARSVELIRRAKNDGVRVTGEATPHHLLLNESKVSELDSNYKMSPPLRSEEDRVAVLEGLRDGTLEAIATDHAPHHQDAKECAFEEAAFGIIGLQTALPLAQQLVDEGHLSFQQLFSRLSSGPARCLNLNVPTLSVGDAADFVVYDPTQEWSFGRDCNYSKSSNSPWYDTVLRGKVRSVHQAGELVFKEGEFLR